MATITKNRVTKQRAFAGPNGNAWKDRFTFNTTATGVAVDSNSTAAVGIGDVVRIGYLPAGLELHDCLAIVSDAFSATTTAKIGFAYADGVDDATVPQDDDYFFAALAINAVGRTRANNTAVAPLRLPKDAYLILTNQVAAQAAVGILNVVVEGIACGAA